MEFDSPDGVFSFRHPADWTVEALSGGTLLMAPDSEADWQANLYFELGSDPEDRTMTDALSDYAAGLRQTKSGFNLLATDTIETAGASAGRIVYTDTSQGTPLLSWELIVPPPSGRNRLFVSASTASAVQETYLPVFESIVKSVRFKG